MKAGKLKKRLLAGALAGTMVASPNLCALGAGTESDMSNQELLQSQIAREAAAEGMVLLENRGQALPLELSGNVALWGSGVYQETEGSISVLQAFEEAGYEITTKEWLDRVMEDNQGQHSGERALTQKDLENGARDGTDVAVYVISRASGAEQSAEEVSLTETEEANIRKMAESFSRSIVVLNVEGVVDTGFVRQIPKLDGVLLMSDAGIQGAKALVDVLNGTVVPSGKLTDTWALNCKDYEEADGIYTGYRYFDTFGLDVAYEFGYGESYTDFAIQVEEVTADENWVEAEVTVTNTGDRYSGKEVVQLYYSVPQGDLEQPYQELGAYAKTDLLAPGESQKLTVGFPTAQMASFDSRRASYVMEAGDYVLRVGDSSRNTEAAAVLSLDKTVATEILGSELTGDVSYQELSNQDATPITYPGEEQEIEQAPVLKLPYSRLRYYEGYNESIYGNEDVTTYVPEGTDPSTLPVSGKADQYDQRIEEVSVAEGASLSDVYRGDLSMEAYVAGLSDEKLAEVIASEDMEKESRDSTDTEWWPSQGLLARTWNVELVQSVAQVVGTWMEEEQTALWMEPDLSIRTDPLEKGGNRGFSEDPLLIGTMGAALVRGVQSVPGVGVALKGFGSTQTEPNRVLSERVLREIYLKGFEIAVKAAQPMAVMASGEKINGQWGAGSYDLCTDILRGEWAFQGMVMTEEDGEVPADEAIHAGSDLLRCVQSADYVVQTIDRSPSGNRDGKLYLGEVQKSAIHILELFMNTILFREVEEQATLTPYTEKYSSILKDYLRVQKGDNPDGINTAELERWITLSESLNESDYSKKSWEALLQALDYAREVLKQSESQQQVNEARLALMEAYLGLEYGAAKEHLQAAVRAAEEILKVYWNYQPDGIAVLREALENGQKVLDEAKASQEKVDQAAEELMEAMERLIVHDDVFMLQNLIDAVTVIDTGKYTSMSAREFEEAVAHAKDVLQNPDRGEEDIKDAYARLAGAVMGLQLKGNKEALLFVIQKAEEILSSASDYVAGSIAGLEEALEAAREVYEDEYVSQKQIAAATEELTRTFMNAMLKGDMDLDGVVSSKDTVILLQYQAERLDLDEQELAGADVNLDGVVDTRDTTLILQYVAEKITSFAA